MPLLLVIYLFNQLIQKYKRHIQPERLAIFSGNK